MDEMKTQEVANVIEATEQPVQVTEATEEKKASMKPRLFVKQGVEIEVGAHVFFREDTGEVVSVVMTGTPLDVDRMTQFLGHVELLFRFSKPMYQHISRYRQRSTIVHADGSTTIDNNKMRDFLIVYHLKGWNLVDDEGKPIELKFDPNGSLANETIDVVYNLDPSIIDVILTALERRLLM